MKTILSATLLALVGLLPVAATAAGEIPPESEAWLSVHFRYALREPTPDANGRIGPGIEVHRVERATATALVVLFPYGGEPRRAWLQGETLTRFLADWERIGLLRCDPKVFRGGEIRKIEDGEEVVMLEPFDDRTLVVTVRAGGKVSTLSIHSPEFHIAALGNRPEGAALRAALDLFHRVFGEVSL